MKCSTHVSVYMPCVMTDCQLYELIKPYNLINFINSENVKMAFVNQLKQFLRKSLGNPKLVT